RTRDCGIVIYHYYYMYGRQPKVILTNVLKTEIGRKYIKTQLITDDKLTHVVKLQSNQQPSSSVDTVEIWQILNPLHQSLFISKRQPKVILTNILRTKTGRKQEHLLTDANLSDTSMLQSDEQPTSSFASLESCSKKSSQQCRILPKRYVICTVSPESLTLHSSTDCSTFSKQKELALEIKSEKVYIGKYKGTATGCIKVSLLLLIEKIELSVDSMHLQRYGLWTNNDSTTSGSNVTIFLWLSSDYAEQIENQMETSVLNSQGTSGPEHNPEIIVVSVLVVATRWSPRALQILTALILYSLLVFSFDTFNDACKTKLKKNILFSFWQESKSDLTQLNYTLLQRQNSGRYSFSISATQRNEWKELRENKGLIQNLIVYPPPPAKGGLGVTREDLECLEYGEFLNDVIIDFYLKYLLLEKAPRELADRSHIFSSFFYKCLTRSEKNSEENPNLSIAQRRHRRVKRWTRRINIFNKDYIFVPVNEESHWYIAVICFPWLEEVVYEDGPQPCSLQSCFQQLTYQPPKNSNTSSEDSVPCILILDSLKASSVQNTVQVLREYLEAEWEAKRKTPREFSKSTVLDFCPRVPKQDNSSDCGVYLLQYVETFFQNPIVNFELPMHLERWFPRQVVRSKREEIRDLILQLHLQQQSGSKS
uniref:SUMO specific peptidase 7 n=1 Tax=Varanus komodoensis TaxID=61221 RepID=A0A8D2LSH7_VARKO